jgi:type I restriction enzyme S subunit
LPRLDEQRAIAALLDRETGRIDALVEKKRLLIERLEEYRTALITRTVTRGLPPGAARAAGLDPSPRLKASGVEWLGDVPEHWEVKALKLETPVLRGASPRPIDDDVYFDDAGSHAWVRIADVTAAGMYLTRTTQRLSDLGVSLSVPLEPGEVFLSIAGSVGKPCITKINCCIHDGFVYFPRWSGDTRYLYYVFASGEPYKGLGKLGTQLNLNTDTVGSIRIGIPPVHEQVSIAEFLVNENVAIESSLESAGRAIQRLQEYRTALVTAAVTGKIDVREQVAADETDADGAPLRLT